MLLEGMHAVILQFQAMICGPLSPAKNSFVWHTRMWHTCSSMSDTCKWVYFYSTQNCVQNEVCYTTRCQKL